MRAFEEVVSALKGNLLGKFIGDVISVLEKDRREQQKGSKEKFFLLFLMSKLDYLCKQSPDLMLVETDLHSAKWIKPREKKVEGVAGCESVMEVYERKCQLQVSFEGKHSVNLTFRKTK